ncbi:hypothetical protein [Streptomyces sp. NPDC048442]|uniref:hypothetical protein n=1 Tax=Streptomyces sp. NPDC048442 TaxID=3154823 RepID=UPI003429DE69
MPAERRMPNAERRTLTLLAPVTTSPPRLVVKAANTQWGNVALNELTVGPIAS